MGDVELIGRAGDEPSQSDPAARRERKARHEGWITFAEARDISGFSMQRIKEAAYAGLIPLRRIGGVPHVEREKMFEYLRGMHRPPTS